MKADGSIYGLTRLLHTDSAAACEHLIDTASVSNCSSGSMTTGSGEAAGEIVAKRQPEGRDERERASQTTAVVAIHHLR